MIRIFFNKYLFRDTFWIAFAQSLTILIELFLMVVLTRCLTVAEVGTHQLLFTYIGMAKLTTLPGMGQIVTKGVVKGYDAICAPALKLSLRFSTFGSLLFLLGGLYSLFATENPVLGRLLVVAAVLFPFYAFEQWDSILIGKRSFRISSLLKVATSLVSLAAIAFTAYASRNLGYVFTVRCGIQAFVLLIGYSIARKQLTVVERNAVYERSLLDQGWKMSFMSVFGFVVGRLDRLLLGTFNPSTLAVYHIGARVPEMIKSIAKNFMSVPIMRLSSTSKEQNVRSILKYGWILLVAGIFISVIVWIISPWFVRVLFGASYGDSVIIIRLLSTTIGIVFLKNVIANMDLMQDTGKYYRRITLASQIIYLPLVYVLFTRYNLLGVVATTLLLESLTFLGFAGYFLHSYATVTGKRYG